MKIIDNLKNITAIEKDFSKWYVDVIKQGQLIEYTDIKGLIIFKPNSYLIWENIQKNLDILFKNNKVENVYLPLLFPLKAIEKEKDHIEGFKPELAIISHIGEKELVDKYVIRPTSEILFANLFKKVINSYNQLPLKYNQWCSVVRWEKTTNPFLRNREFLWQEGHTAHANQDEAISFAQKMIMLYKNFLEDYLAIPSIVGEKTLREKFAGAKSTFTLESMMKNGKMLQTATSHFLSQNFSKIFNINFKNNLNKLEYIFQTSWGISTRLIGAIIMTHGDNRGIVIPPKIAPYQVEIIEILPHKNQNIEKVSLNIEKDLNTKNIRVINRKSKKQFGFQVSESEIQGVPIRIEIGPKDIEKNVVTIVRRDNLIKQKIAINKIYLQVIQEIENMHLNLLTKAKKNLNENITFTSDYEIFQDLIKKNKIVIVPFVDDINWEEKIKNETGATIRCILNDKNIVFNEENQKKFKINSVIKENINNKKFCKCLITKQLTNRYVLFAKSY